MNDLAGALPAWPSAWYAVARTSELPRGGVMLRTLAGSEVVLFRSEAGKVAALDAHCPHMGAHLRHGSVHGEVLRCPLHHWRWDGSGVCRAGPPEGQRTHFAARCWPVEERFGLLFVYLGQGEPPPLPIPSGEEECAWTTGRPVVLATDWRAMMTNGFDLLHLGAVHHRQLLEEPRLWQEGGTLHLRYRSRVTEDGGWADRFLGWLAGGEIRVHQHCHGPVIVVESEVGSTRTAAVLGLLPVAEGVRAYGAFGIRNPGWSAPLRLLLTRFLFLSFLKKDFAVVEGMRLDLEGVEDRGVQALSTFLRSLPVAGEE